MGSAELINCLQLEHGRLERVRYFPRQLLTADDLAADSDYFRDKQRRHNRLLHGWGTVCGLAVSPAHTPELPWRVQIAGGYALGPYGDEIYVAEPVFLDLALCGPGTVTDPCAPDQLHTPGSVTGGTTIFVAIKYAECLARPVRAMPAGCACEEEACEYSRIRDSFQIECLTELPPSHQPPPGPSLCDLIRLKQLPLCPPCPAEPWVVLAQVTLPASNENIAENQIDNFTFRRQVFSTAVLQEQLIKCCCPTPPKVVSIDPADDATINIAEQEPPAAIVIEFDKDLNPDTVNAGAIVVRGVFVDRFPPQAAFTISGSVEYDVNTRAARFTPNNPFGGQVPQGEKIAFDVSLSGNEPNAIRSKDGLALDGDGDGLPGGNFTSRFTLEIIVE